MATAERAIGTVRLDADDLSPEAQREIIEQVAEDQGMTLVGIVEGQSEAEIDAELEQRKGEYDTVLDSGELVEDPDDYENDEDDEDEYEDEEIILDGAGRPISDYREFKTWVISQAIRNELEQFHGGGAFDPSNPNSGEGFITDKQMRAINVVIRRTVYDAFGKLDNPDADENAGMFVWFQLQTVNDYMEPPGSPELEAAYEAVRDGKEPPASR